MNARKVVLDGVRPTDGFSQIAKGKRLVAAKEYMVLTQKDRAFGGKFNPLKVQEAINALANQGWVLAEAVTATFPTLGSNREELVIFLERDKV